MIQKNDFIALEYTGTFKDTKKVFDTTKKEDAIKAGLFNPKLKYNPHIVCIGQNMLVSGLEKDILAGKEVGKNYSVELTPEESFGKKDPKALRLVPLKVFKDKNINPFPGLQVQVGNNIATIKTVNSGRCIVDFNNPLAGHDIVYEYKIVSIITDEKIKVENIFKLFYGIEIKVEQVSNKFLVKLPQGIPKEIVDEITKKVKDVANVDLVIEEIKKESIIENAS